MVARRMRLIGIAALLGLFLAALACQRPAVPTPAAPTPVAIPSPGATPAVAPTPVPSPTVATTPEARPTGELRFATGFIGGEAGDPTLGAGSATQMFAPLFEWLVGVTPEGQLSKELGLARDWEVVHTPTRSTYTFYLREGIKFHNGDELTAEDVKFSMEYFMRPASQASAVATWRTYIDRVEVAGRYKVVVHTKKPYGYLVVDTSRLGTVMGMVLPKKYIQEVGEEEFNRNPIGTGPYRFKERVVGSYFRVEAVDKHWLIGVPRFKTVTIFLIPEEFTRISLLKVGQVDIGDISREKIGEVTAAGFNTFLKPGSTVATMFMGNQWQGDTYLYDERVREALNLAINREEMLKFMLKGQGEILGNPYYGSWALGYKPLPLPPYPYDPERARALLKQAFPEGVKLTLNSFPRPGLPELMKMNEAIASMWAMVGVKVGIVPMEWATHRPLQSVGKIPNVVAGHATSNRVFWVSVWRSQYHSNGLLTVTKDPKLDKFIEALEQEVDMDKVGQLQWETARYMREHHKVVSLLEAGDVYAVNPKKVTRWNLGRLPYDINFWDLAQR